MTVAILLSTKNGAPFILEQLISITFQSYPDRSLFWRDDGSTDATVNIARAYLHRDPLDVGALGITKSYRRLLQTAWDNGCDLFAFADQDDVWAIDKVERGVDALAKVSGPALYCARQTLVDVNLRRIGASQRFREPIGFPAALTQNIAAGCTVMINRPAAELILRTLHAQKYHDWWCYIIVTAAGGQVIADDAEVIQYRQHANNLIGAPSKLLPRAVGAIKRGQNAFMAVFREHVVLLEMQTDLLSPWAFVNLDIISHALNGGLIDKWRALELPQFRRQTLLENWLFRLWFMTG